MKLKIKSIAGAVLSSLKSEGEEFDDLKEKQIHKIVEETLNHIAMEYSFADAVSELENRR